MASAPKGIRTPSESISKKSSQQSMAMGILPALCDLVVDDLVGSRESGAAAAQGVQRDRQADHEDEARGDAGDLLAIGLLALVDRGVYTVGADDLEQGDGARHSGYEHEEVEHEADERAELTHVREDLLHGGEQKSRAGGVRHVVGRAGGQDGHTGHDGDQSVAGGDYDGVLLQVLFLIEVGAVGYHTAHAEGKREEHLACRRL